MFPAEQWFKVTSPNFELFTTNGAKKGRDAVLYFEQVRELFAKISKANAQPGPRVRIIAFQSDKQYEPYRLNEFAAAYYANASSRDYIVMKNLDPESNRVALHEYFHLIVQHSGLPLPAWLNEGMADVYSTLKPVGKKVQIGEVLPGRLQEVRVGKWLDLGTLLAVDHRSPYYNEKNKAGMFYAQSWALAHMLYLSNEYWPKFGDFLKLIRPDNTQAETFQRVYGKSLDEVTKDLSQYVRGTSFNGAILNMKLETSVDEPDAVPATPLESDLALAEVLTVIHKNEEAKAAYESLARENPKAPEVELALAHLEWMNRNFDAMGNHYARAIELAGADPKVNLDEAHFYLGMRAVNANRFAEAVVQLQQMKRVELDQAPNYFRALAYAHYRLHMPEDARKFAESALKYKMSPKETAEVQDLLAHLHEPPPPLERATATSPEAESPRHLIRRPASASNPDPPAAPPRQQTTVVEGMLQQVDCLGKSARLRILADGKQLSFLIEDPRSVVIKSATSEGGLSLTCGPQKPVKIALEEFPKPDPASGTEGLVRSIEFR